MIGGKLFSHLFCGLRRSRQSREAALLQLRATQARMTETIREVSEIARDIAVLLQNTRSNAEPEAVLLCDTQGVVITGNEYAVEMFSSGMDNQMIEHFLRFEAADQSWENLLRAIPALEKTTAVAAIPYSGKTFAAEVTMIRLPDTEPDSTRVLITVRRTDPVEVQRHAEIRERVSQALMRIEARTDEPQPRA